MRIRNKGILLNLTEEELLRLDIKVKKSKMTRSAYIRCLLNDYCPVEAPHLDYFVLLRAIRAIGNNINQIAIKANALGFIDVPSYNEEVKHLRNICDEMQLIMLPRKQIK